MQTWKSTISGGRGRIQGEGSNGELPTKKLSALRAPKKGYKLGMLPKYLGLCAKIIQLVILFMPVCLWEIDKKRDNCQK